MPRFKIKSFTVTVIAIFVLIFPLITVFKPTKSKIRNSASAYAMSALKDEPIGTTRIPRLIHQTGILLKKIFFIKCFFNILKINIF